MTIVEETPVEAPVASAAPEVPHASFNFISETWNKKQDEKKLNLVLVLGSIVLLAAVFGAGYTIRAGNAGLEAQRDEYAVAAQQASTQTSAITGGVEDLPLHLRDRRAAITAALANDIAVALVLDPLFAATPSNVRIVSLKVEHPAVGGAATAAPAEDDVSAEPDAEEPANPDDPAAPAPAPTTARLTVTAVGADSSAGVQWRDSLRTVALFDGADPRVTPSGDNLSLSLAVDLAEVQPQLRAALELLGATGAPIAVDPAADPTAEPTTTEGG